MIMSRVRYRFRSDLGLCVKTMRRRHNLMKWDNNTKMSSGGGFPMSSASVMRDINL